MAVLINVDWLNYPGFEAWKFVNLAIFIGAALYLHRRFGKPVSEAFRARAVKIRAELENARQRKERAAAELAEVEEQRGRLESEVAKIRSEAQKEADAERDRIRASTEVEIAKLKAQGEKEIEKARINAQWDLRKFAATQGVALAETLIRKELNAADDNRLIGISADQFGG